MPEKPRPTDTLPIERWPEWNFVQTEHRLLRDLLSPASRSKNRRDTLLFPLLDGASESVNTLEGLVRQLAIRDAYVIARVIFETVVNATYILTDDGALAQRARSHAAQKALRDLERTIELAGEEVFKLRWSGADAVLGDSANQALLQEFTSKSGREITSWTPENVLQRVERIDQTFGRRKTEGLAWGLLLYRHASEIAHGTLYGALFSWGAAQPQGAPQSTKDLKVFRHDQGRLILMLIGFSLASAVEICADVLSLSDIAKDAADAQRSFSKRERPDA